jgi:hypothetical protein
MIITLVSFFSQTVDDEVRHRSFGLSIMPVEIYVK